MKKIMISLVAILAVSGCGSDGTTYVQEAPILPDTTNGTNILVTTDGDVGISYTEIGDGNILIDCGDSYQCGVFELSPLDDNRS